MPTKKIDLLPDKLDLVLYAGDGVSILLTVTDNAGDPLPVSGAYNAQIRKDRLDAEILAEFNVNFTDDPGTILISLLGTQTAALITDEEKFNGVWDVQWIPESAEPITIAQGKVEVDADVTRD